MEKKQLIGAHFHHPNIGPLRPEPERIYALNEVDSKVWKKRGLSAFLKFLGDEINQKESEEINNWLIYLGLGEKIQLKESKKIGSAILSQVMFMELNNSREFNIKDIGFGASQVLPIIIQCVIAKPDSFIIIEQPELHLHPEVQTDLVDLFINRINIEDKKDKKGIRFFLETHSEHLLLRFQRRTAETTYYNKMKEFTEQSYKDLKMNNLLKNTLIQLIIFLNKIFVGEEKFLDALIKEIGDKQTVKYQSAILKSAEKEPESDKHKSDLDNYKLNSNKFGLVFIYRSKGKSKVEVITIDHRGQLIEPSTKFQDFFKYDYDEVVKLNQTTGKIINLETRDESND